MRLTLYEHFVAGTDKQELKPIVERLRQHKVKLILDYSMESDIANEKQLVFCFYCSHSIVEIYL